MAASETTASLFWSAISETELLQGPKNCSEVQNFAHLFGISMPTPMSTAMFVQPQDETQQWWHEYNRQKRDPEQGHFAEHFKYAPGWQVYGHHDTDSFP